MALLSPSLFCWLHKTTLFRKLVGCEVGKLVFQNNHLVGVWVPGSFMDQRAGR